MRTALAALALLALAAPTAAAEPRDPRLQRVETFAFAAGTQRDLERRLAGYDLAVVDAADTPARTVRRLRASGAIVLGYLSVGTIERWRPWYRRARRFRLDLWGDWGEWYARASAPGFRRLMARRVAPRLVRKGFDGLFLDNVDMIESHRRQTRGMRALVRSLARLVHGRGGLLFTQNGERSIGPLMRHLDGWNREDVSSTYDFERRRYQRVPAADRASAARALERIGGAGLLVTATDYVRPGDTAGAAEAARVACAAGALPFVADIRLTRITQPPRKCA